LNLSREKFLILLIVLVGLSGIIEIARAGTLKDSEMELTQVQNSSVAWGDIDNDGDFDLAIMGWDGTNRHFQIYKNGANNKLTLSQSLTGVSNGGLSFADYDRDGDLDLAITGKVTEYGTTKIYQNDGEGNFSDSGIEMIDVYNSSLAWGDYDNDGDLDLVVIGARMGAPGIVAKIYENKGNGTFEDSGIIDLTPVASGSVAWADYDNDGDLDLALSGEKGVADYICKIYKNDYRNSPANPFSIAVHLTGVMNSSLAWGDYNNDGYLDIAICGESAGGYVSEIWKNNGDGTFTLAQSLTTGVSSSSLAWGDYDNDGDLDLAVVGLTNAEQPSSEIYKNNGDLGYTFSEDIGQTYLTNVEEGSVAWCDYDGDKDIDLALTGYSGSEVVTKIYKNSESANSLPTPPDSSQFETAYDTTTKQLTISWPAGSDGSETPQAGLYYNFRIGSESGKDDLVAARYGTPLFGNFVSKSTATVGGKQTRTFSLYAKGYYWSVQAIDTGLGYSWSQEGGESGWSGEDHFEDTSPPPAPETPTDEGEYTYDTTIRFSWTQNNPDPETAIYNYWLQVRSREDGKLKFDGNVGDVKSYRVSGCEYNKTYEAQVRAQSGFGYGAWSGPSDGIMVVRLLDISNNLIHPKEGADKTATIKYFIINPAKVNLKIYNLVGELVRTLVDNQNIGSGSHSESWSGENEDGSTVASGIYLVHIEVAGENATEKICVVK
jgi:hypothetical protein